jgi:hypothetical protein
MRQWCRVGGCGYGNLNFGGQIAGDDRCFQLRQGSIYSPFPPCGANISIFPASIVVLICERVQLGPSTTYHV